SGKGGQRGPPAVTSFLLGATAPGRLGVQDEYLDYNYGFEDDLVGYMVSRGLAKSGSREPYTVDHDDH
ncbi:MAG: hypothetical protein ACR2L8_03655, partial [Solirubrobacteraceae bacterium]